MASSSSRLSEYAEALSTEAKKRYKEKLSIIGGDDPFLRDVGVLSERFPPVEQVDTVSFLVLRTSFVTEKQLKARKGLEAYNQFVSGWVKDVKNWKVAGKCVVTGRVSSR